MRLSLADMLEALALGQARHVAPALGDSHAGKTAQTISALLLMLAEEARSLCARRHAAIAAIEALLAGVRTGEPQLDLLLEGLARPDAQEPADARHEALLHALERLHDWADRHDPALSARCRALLCRLAAGEQLSPPLPPGS